LLHANSRRLPSPARIGWDFIGRLLWDVHTSRDPKRARARIGRWALAVTTRPEADQRKVFQARLPVSVWPFRALKVTAVDERTGELTVFDSAGDASVVDAVGASCAVPGTWPPVTIGERRFMDGGMRTIANADLAHGYQRVVIVVPVAVGIGFMASPCRQAAALTEAGARVVLVRPDRAGRARHRAQRARRRAERRPSGPPGRPDPGRLPRPGDDPGDPGPQQPTAVTRLR
jgi:NTE family protein